MSHFVILNAGSNLGNRRLNLSKALSALNREFGAIEMSHTVESEPWGYDSPHPYLNVCFMFSTDLEPEEVLARVQQIERGINPAPHRDPSGAYADRAIDIDIIAIDDMVIDTEALTVPHRHLAERSFFLEPMAEIAPGWRHPVTGLTPGEMLEALKMKE